MLLSIEVMIKILSGEPSSQGYIIVQKEERMVEERKRHWDGHRTPWLLGPIWIMGWLFTIGYVGLVWWQIILGIVIWPYYLGRVVGG